MKIRDRIKSFRRVQASTLLPNPKNWRKHPESQENALRSILADVGFADAVLARETKDGLMLIDGHLRAELSPDCKVPVLVLDVTEAEADKILATHDIITEMATADQGALADLLEGIESLSDELDAMVSEYCKDLPSAEKDVVEDEAPIDAAAELQTKWQTAEGQLWAIEGKAKHRLVCGDCGNADVLSQLFDSDLFDLAVTSPPYNHGIGKFQKSGIHKESTWINTTNAGGYADDMEEDVYREWQVELVNSWKHYGSSKCSLFYNHKNRFRDKACISPWSWLGETDWKVRQEIIWQRSASVTLNMRGFMPVDERIFWMYANDDFVFNDATAIKTWSTVWTIKAGGDDDVTRMHGCAFPVELPSRAIQACSSVGGLVFEPFMGSGTTMVAAEQLERRCFGIELEPKYVAVCLERMERLGCKCQLCKS